MMLPNATGHQAAGPRSGKSGDPCQPLSLGRDVVLCRAGSGAGANSAMQMSAITDVPLLGCALACAFVPLVSGSVFAGIFTAS